MASSPTTNTPPRIITHFIRTPASPEDTAKFTQLRLSSLLANPEAFSEKYPSAIQLSPSDWEQRLNTPGRFTIVALDAGTTQADVDSSTSRDWIGTLTVLTPTFFASRPDTLPTTPRLARAIQAHEISRYLLVGMWVHPDMRRLGTGMVLMRAALDAIARDADESDVGIIKDKKPKVVFLEVNIMNRAAQDFYKRAGFVQEEVLGGNERHVWMTTTVI